MFFVFITHFNINVSLKKDTHNPRVTRTKQLVLTDSLSSSPNYWTERPEIWHTDSYIMT